MMKCLSICLAALAVLAVYADDAASSRSKMFVYRGTFTDLTTNRPITGGVYDMTFRFYDSDEDGATPLTVYAVSSVPINSDGSFDVLIGNDALASLVATGTVTYVGLSVGNAPELKPRRELRPVVGVNRAAVADRGTPNLTIGLLAASQVPFASSLAANGAEIAGDIVATNCGAIAVSRFSVHDGERTVIRRGAGVKVFASPISLKLNRVKPSGESYRQNEVLATASEDGVVLVHSDSENMPGVVQFYGKGDEIRCPVTVDGAVKVTLWPFIQY